jgi:hypothetical protein
MPSCSNCKQEFAATYKKNGSAHKCCEKCRAKSQRYQATSVAKDPTANAEYQRELRRRRREDALTAYGGRCTCCGETAYEFLTIDHPDGGGRKEREGLHMWGSAFIGHLARQGYPPGYRVLCHNCNSAYGYYGYCPHAKAT